MRDYEKMADEIIELLGASQTFKQDLVDLLPTLIPEEAHSTMDDLINV